jgi:quercetin dioxygenase-like cupin family protein
MTIAKKWARLAVAIWCAAVGVGHFVAAWATSDGSQDQTERARITFSHALPQLDGGHLEVTVVEVTYGPGESSPPHSHPCAVTGYVVKGALRTRVGGGPEAIYKVGESFYEAPNGVHLVSANASKERPAKFIAYFVCDHDAPLSVAVPESKAAEDQ